MTLTRLNQFFSQAAIGRLSISGTVNDISAMVPALRFGLRLYSEEGLLISDFERILASMRETCIEAGVGIVTGDTKAVEKGALGGLVMNVSGIGKRTPALEHNLAVARKYRAVAARWTLDSNLAAGDKIILNRHHRRPRLSSAFSPAGFDIWQRNKIRCKTNKPHDYSNCLHK